MPSFWSRNHQPRPDLEFAGDGAILEIAEHGGEGVIVGGIEVVDDRLGQGIVQLQPVEIGGQGAGLREIADGIEAGIRSEFGKQPGVVAAERAQMQLLDPAFSASSRPKKSIMITGELGVLGRRGGLAAAGFGEDGAGDFVEAEVGVALIQAVVGKPAALRVEILVAVAERFEEIFQVHDVGVGSGFESLDPFVEGAGLVDGQGLSGRKAGNTRMVNPEAADALYGISGHPPGRP